MDFRLKAFILWFLIAVLPVQGFAAILRMSCSPRQQFTVQSHLPGHLLQANAPAVHDHPAMMHVMAAPAGADTDSAVLPHPTNQSHKHTSAFCSTCGDCCIGGLALPSQVNLVLPTVELLAKAPRLFTFLAGFIPDSLDRPPRHTSA